MLVLGRHHAWELAPDHPAERTDEDERSAGGKLGRPGLRAALTAPAGMGQWLVAELLLQGNERILDLGCGDGSITRQLADRVPHGSVLGVDAAPEMLEAGRDKCGPNMTVQHLDINDLAFEAEFDVVFSNATLHWVHDHAGLLRSVHRGLRPGGILRAQFGGDANCPNLIECVQRQMATPPFPKAFAGFRWPWYFPSLRRGPPASGSRSGTAWSRRCSTSPASPTAPAPSPSAG